MSQKGCRFKGRLTKLPEEKFHLWTGCTRAMISWRVPALLRRSENRFGVVADDRKIDCHATIGVLFLGSVVGFGTVLAESQQRETERLMIDGRCCLLQRVCSVCRNGRGFLF